MITRRQQEILNHLRFREAGETDSARQVCWLEPTPHGRVALIVPDMTGVWAKSPFNLLWTTLEALADERLIGYGEHGEMPKFYGQRVTHGQKIWLTSKGRALTTNGTNK